MRQTLPVERHLMHPRHMGARVRQAASPSPLALRPSPVAPRPSPLARQSADLLLLAGVVQVGHVQLDTGRGFVTGMAAVAEELLQLMSFDVLLLGVLHQNGKKQTFLSLIGRCSSRASAVDLNVIMQQWGGGGHPAAAATSVRLYSQAELDLAIADSPLQPPKQQPKHKSKHKSKQQPKHKSKGASSTHTKDKPKGGSSKPTPSSDEYKPSSDELAALKAARAAGAAEAGASASEGVFLRSGAAPPQGWQTLGETVDVAAALEEAGSAEQLREWSAADEASAVLQQARDLVLSQIPPQITAGELMTKTVFAVSPNDTMLEAMQLMDRLSKKAIPVLDEHRKLLGMLKYRDVVKAAQASKGGQKVKSWIRREVVTVAKHTPLAEIEAALVNGQTGRLPVVDDNQTLLGLVTRTDVLRHQNLYPQSIIGARRVR